jgi:3-oxoacyl-[acyl-carrier protein] reductase
MLKSTIFTIINLIYEKFTLYPKPILKLKLVSTFYISSSTYKERHHMQSIDQFILGRGLKRYRPGEYLFTERPSLTRKELIDAFIQRTGPVNILINNTGGPPAGLIQMAKPEEFLTAFNQHLICNHILVQALLPKMKAIGYGRIINVISTSVKIPLKGLGVSNTIRAAVGNWSKTLASEVASFGITVNNVLPGATKTTRLEGIIQNKANNTSHSISEIEKEMLSEIPAARFGNPEEIAAAIAFLATPAAAYITGTNIVVDGGRTGNL